MSWFSSIIPSSVKKAVTKATYYVPPLAVVAPIGGKEQMDNAMKGLATGAGIAASVAGVKTLTTPAAPAAPVSPFDPVTGEFTDAYLSATGGGGSSSSLLSSVASVAKDVAPLLLNNAGASTNGMESQAQYPYSYQYIPQSEGSTFMPSSPAYPYSYQYVPQQQSQAAGLSTTTLLLLGLGAVLLIGVFHGK